MRIRPVAAPARSTARGLVLVVFAGFVAGACTEHDGLALLDLRASGPLGAEVARVRLSAKGWPTKVVSGAIGSGGFRVGYYGPADGGAVSVTAQALDAVDCLLGMGSATVPPLAAGATSDPTTLFVRPTPETGCVPDAGMDAGGEDAGEDGNGQNDAGGDAGEVDGGIDAPDEAAADAATN